MAERNISVLFSHCALVGVGIYCLIQIKDEDIFCGHITFGVITINNIFGICWNLNSDDYMLQNLFKISANIQSLFALSYITTTVWLNHGYPAEWIWTWAVVPICLLFCYVVNGEVDTLLVELMILLNLVGLGAVSVVKRLYYGIAASMAYAIAQCFKNSYYAVYNFGLCCFAYFALRSIGFGDNLY